MTQSVEIRDDPYIQKVGAKYRDRPSVDQQCDGCYMFTADATIVSGTLVTGTCLVVMGRVYATGWCRFFDRLGTTNGSTP